MNGVIWSKMKKTFVPISSVPVYAMLQQERIRQNRALEIHNFQLQNVTLTSFQEPNFFEFYDNDTKSTGICGELWNLLSESLNFTLQLVRSNETSLGATSKNFSLIHGLLGTIGRNETIAIPKLETYPPRFAITDFTIPLWMKRYQMYINQESIYDGTWVAKVFSWKIWCVILAMYVLLSVCSFCSQTIRAKIENKRDNTTFSEHFFYNFGMLCNQNYIPETFDGRSRILEMSLGIFSCVTSIAFGAVLFIYLTKRIFVPPFNSFESLLTDTTYKIVTLNGSTTHIMFQVGGIEIIEEIKKARRIMAASFEEMHKIVCFSKHEKYTILQSEDEHKTSEHLIPCHLTPIKADSGMDIWIASGIVKNFKYKRTIDLGILKLMEVGVWSVLKDRWLTEKIKHEENVQTTEAIGMDQVSLIIGVMYCGMITALIIFIIEKVVHAYKFKQS